MVQQIVRPSGAEREAAWVLLATALILAGAAVAVNLRHPPPAEHAPSPAHHIDSRTGLTPAEQGLFADLLVAAEEIAALRSADGAAPGLDALAAEGLTPFVRDPAWRNRGALNWTEWRAGATAAYLGLSADPAVAGSFLLVTEPDHPPLVWLHRAAAAVDSVDETALIAAGWRRVTSTFTTGVTR